MTKLVLLSVGRLRGQGLKEAVADYEARLRHYVRFESIEVGAAGLPDARADEARRLEATALAKRIPADLELIALTRDGKAWSTRQLAKYLGDLLDYGRAGAAFVIGGAHGLGTSILERATRTLRLSSMTLPHEMARLVLTEQLYRAGTILRAEPYHKGS